MAKNKHLTDSERLQIKQWLKERTSIKQIAAKLGKDKSTISREIRARALPSDKYAPYRIHNRCVKRRDCRKYHLCEDKVNCTKRCSACNLCNELCLDYEEEVCHKLYEPPYVCNGCFDERQCVLRKKYWTSQGLPLLKWIRLSGVWAERFCLPLCLNPVHSCSPAQVCSSG